MCAVCSTKCIVHIDITQGCQILAERLTVLGFLGTVTGVLKQNNLAILHRLNGCLCVRSNHFRIGCKFHFLSQKFRQTNGYRCQRQLRLRLSLRFTKVGAENYLSTVRNQFFDRRKRCHQTVFIGDLSFF